MDYSGLLKPPVVPAGASVPTRLSVGSRTPLSAELLAFDVDVSWWVTPDGYDQGYYAKTYDALRHWFATEFSYWRPHYSNKQIPTAPPGRS